MKITGLIVLLFIGVMAQADFYGDTKPFSLITGKIDGMEILKELPTNTGLSKIGVKKGDIVMSVNYLPIMNFEAARTAYGNKDILAATVIRNDHSLLLRLNNERK